MSKLISFLFPLAMMLFGCLPSGESTRTSRRLRVYNVAAGHTIDSVSYQDLAFNYLPWVSRCWFRLRLPDGTVLQYKDDAYVVSGDDGKRAFSACMHFTGDSLIVVVRGSSKILDTEELLSYSPDKQYYWEHSGASAEFRVFR